MTTDPPRRISTIDTAQVKHIAHLARLGLSEVECQAFSRQLTTIIDYFNLLQEANVDDVLPANELQILRAKLRPDAPVLSLSREEFLSNAPQRKDGYVRAATIYPGDDGESDQAEE